MLCSVCFGDRGRYERNNAGSGALVVAASNAPNQVKRHAWKICNGTDDHIEIQAAINATNPVGNVIGSGVVLSAGKFSIGAPIVLPGGSSIRGQGINVTVLYMADNSNANMFEFSEFTSTSVKTFISLSDMLLEGNDANNDTNSNGIECFLRIKDFHLKNLFISNFGGSGLVTNGSWGHVYNNVIIEFCTEYGINANPANEWTFTGGTTSGAMTIYNAVTQAGTGGTGWVKTSVGSSAASIVIIQDRSGGGAEWNDSGVITETASGNTYTPTTISATLSSGPKINGCKIMSNKLENIYLHGVQGAVITGCEFASGSAAPESGTAGAIVLDGCRYCIINSNIFGVQEIGCDPYIQTTKSRTPGDAIQIAGWGNVISGNVFNLGQTGTVAIQANHKDQMDALITGNVCRKSEATAKFFVSNGVTEERNTMHNNLVIADYSTGGITTLTEVTGQDQIRDLTNSTHTNFGFVHDGTYSNALFTTGRVITLPDAIFARRIKFVLEVAQTLELSPATGDLIETNDFDGTFTALDASENLSAGAIGDYIQLDCYTAGKWRAVEQAGTWTQETP